MDPARFDAAVQTLVGGSRRRTLRSLAALGALLAAAGPRAPGAAARRRCKEPGTTCNPAGRPCCGGVACALAPGPFEDEFRCGCTGGRVCAQTVRVLRGGRRVLRPRRRTSLLPGGQGCCPQGSARPCVPSGLFVTCCKAGRREPSCPGLGECCRPGTARPRSACCPLGPPERLQCCRTGTGDNGCCGSSDSCCGPGDGARCCSENNPVCCRQPRDPSRPCCPRGLPNCCPLGSRADCCPPGFSVLLRAGARADCCPRGTECCPEGCCPTEDAAVGAAAAAGAAGGPGGA